MRAFSTFIFSVGQTDLRMSDDTVELKNESGSKVKVHLHGNYFIAIIFVKSSAKICLVEEQTVSS